MPDLIDERWCAEGWLHLERFFGEVQVESINALVAELWRSKPRHVTVDDVDLLQRTTMHRLQDAQRKHRIKLNDLYLTYPEIRELLLDARLVAIVARLLSDNAVLCNSLNLEKSSAQEYHADSLYMTPPTPGALVACWIALEDVVPGSGPLRLYPGSHLFAPFTFSEGRHAVPDEMPLWAEHMRGQISTRGSEPRVIYAGLGDVILWHGDLLHGAEPISMQDRTRRSVIGHYFGLSDSVRRGYRLIKSGAHHWIKRPPQPVDVPSRIRSAVERRVQVLRSAYRRMARSAR